LNKSKYNEKNLLLLINWIVFSRAGKNLGKQVTLFFRF
jgi:hypothetical protein